MFLEIDDNERATVTQAPLQLPEIFDPILDVVNRIHNQHEIGFAAFEAGRIRRREASFDIAARFLRLLLLIDVIQKPLVDIDRDHFGRLQRDRESEVSGADADIGDGFALEGFEAGDHFRRLLPFRPRGIFETRDQVIEVGLVHELVRRAFLRVSVRVPGRGVNVVMFRSWRLRRGGSAPEQGSHGELE